MISASLPSILLPGALLDVSGVGGGTDSSGALGCLSSLLALAVIPLAAYATIQIGGRIRRSGKERADQPNFKQLGKTPVNGSTPNGGRNP